VWLFVVLFVWFCLCVSRCSGVRGCMCRVRVLVCPCCTVCAYVRLVRVGECVYVCTAM